MLGLEDAISSLISELRSREISLSKKMRWIMVAYNASGNNIPNIQKEAFPRAGY